MIGKRILFGMALSAVLAVPAVAGTYDLAGDFSATTQGNNGWSYGTQWQGAGLTLFGGPATSYTGVRGGIEFSSPVTSWGSWTDSSDALIYTNTATNVQRYYTDSNTAKATLDAGKVAFAPARYGNVAARWTATVEGDYSYTATFTAKGAPLNGVYVDLADPTTDTIQILGTEKYMANYSSSFTFTGTKHLTAGQSLDFVETPLESNGSQAIYDWAIDADGVGAPVLPLVQVDATITSASPAPEPGSLMALASGLIGLVGFGIRRRKA